MTLLLLVAGSLLTFRLVHRSSVPVRVGARRGLRTSLALLLVAVAVMVAANAVGGPVVPALGMLAAGGLLGAAVAIREALRARQRDEQEGLSPEG
jgi:1,4-dihydroxy-2-naphthoate octaprenyltransferase